MLFVRAKNGALCWGQLSLNCADQSIQASLEFASECIDFLHLLVILSLAVNTACEPGEYEARFYDEPKQQKLHGCQEITAKSELLELKPQNVEKRSKGILQLCSFIMVIFLSCFCFLSCLLKLSLRENVSCLISA